MFTAAGQRPDSRQASLYQMEIAGDRHASILVDRGLRCLDAREASIAKNVI